MEKVGNADTPADNFTTVEYPSRIIRLLISKYTDKFQNTFECLRKQNRSTVFFLNYLILLCQYTINVQFLKNNNNNNN